MRRDRQDPSRRRVRRLPDASHQAWVAGLRPRWLSDHVTTADID